MKRLLRVALTVFMCGLGAVWAAILDVDAIRPENNVLVSLATFLDEQSIDVILGEAKSYDVGERARVALLSGFSTGKLNWGSIEKGSWEDGFRHGMIGALFAVKARQEPNNKSKFVQTQAKCKKEQRRPARETCAFVNRWLSAPPESRVFVAFTRSDVDPASRVKQALEDAGYVVFVYLRNSDSEPWAESEMVGEAFAQSHHRLVIDTANSRGSEGVKFEAFCSKCERILSPPRPQQKSRWLNELRRAGT